MDLTNAFGDNFYQDNEKIVIRKSDLLGLTPLPNNTAESLLIALVLKFRGMFEGVLLDDNNDQLTDEDNSPITYNQAILYPDFRLWLWRVTIDKKNNLICKNYRLVLLTNQVIEWTDRL
ncbi:MAG TPA: hypothetical protein V6C58_02280 [Allocoleopsis sp.]